jgi:5-methylcytosine-specific restriction enzyme A
MPTKPPRLCGCGHRVAPGVLCPCERKAVRDRNARHDRKRPSSSARGYTSKWEAARARFLHRNPLCVICGAPADVVDHKTPHRGDQSLFWDTANWQPMCRHHHNSAKQRIERRQIMEAR